MSSAGQAKLSLAVRGFADTASDGLTETWRGGIRVEANRSLGALPDALDLAIASTPLPSRGSWWWPVFSVVQWIVLLTGLVGVGWLLAAALFPTLGLPAPEVPKVEGWAVPTLLIVGAVLAGTLLSLLGTALGAVAGAARRRQARRRLLAAVDEVVQRQIVGPVRADLDRARDFEAARAIAARP